MKMMVNGQLIGYRDEGEGEIILLLHGWGTDLATFDGICTHMQKKYRVIRLDFPGFGSSPRPKTDWNVDDYATLVRDFLDKKEIYRLYAVGGHSFGGRVILKSVGEGYISPERIILIGAAGIKPATSLRSLAYKGVAKIGKVGLRIPGLKSLSGAARKRLYEHAGSTDYIDADALRNIFLNVINEDLTHYATRIARPTLLLWGRDDDSTPLSDAEKLHELITGSQLEVVPAAGHFVYLERPDESNEIIEKFLL